MEKELNCLIIATQNYREYCKRNNLAIDAAACSIRLATLRQALDIIQKHSR